MSEGSPAFHVLLQYNNMAQPQNPYKGSCMSCQHVTSKDSEKTSIFLELDKGNAQQKVSSSFLIIPALETIVSQQQRSQLKQDNDPSSSSAPAASQSSFLEQVSIVKCTSCDKSVALLVKGCCNSINGLLQDKTKPNGWKKVETDSDRLVLFILNQIVYREYEVPDEDELQVEYAFPPDTDLSKVLWMNGNAVGFYTVKPKGTLDIEAMECYSMTVLDTLFIRNSDRRKGYALAAIQDLLFDFPDQNIGFSAPISLPMIKVLKKHLELHPTDRMKLWEITGCGSEGNCQILWFLLRKS